VKFSIRHSTEGAAAAIRVRPFLGVMVVHQRP